MWICVGLRAAYAISVVAFTIAAARRWLRVVAIEGASMQPTYRDGDRVLAVYGGEWLRVRPGDVVVARAPRPNWAPEQGFDDAYVTVVKRVKAVGGAPRPDPSRAVPAGAVFIEGDAPGGYDSTVFGPLPRSQVLGRVLLRL